MPFDVNLEPACFNASPASLLQNSSDFQWHVSKPTSFKHRFPFSKPPPPFLVIMSLPDITIDGTAYNDTGSFKLPNPDFIDLDDGDRRRLSEDVNVKHDLSMLVHDYVLCTLSEALTLVHRNVCDPRHAKRYEFHYDREVRYADARWDIFTLVCHVSPLSPHVSFRPLLVPVART
jgi:hypothetical protein